MRLFEPRAFAAAVALFVAGCGTTSKPLVLPDMATTPPDFARDLTVIQDFAEPIDLVVERDFTVPPDFAKVPPKTVPVTVGQNGSTFNPKIVMISVHDTVKWTWKGSGHNVVSGNNCVANNIFCSPNDQGCFQAPVSNVNTTYEHTFNTPGTFNYFCTPHCGAGMTGTVVVSP